MTENAYDAPSPEQGKPEAAAGHTEPQTVTEMAVLDIKIALVVGDEEQMSVLARESVAAEVTRVVLDDGSAGTAGYSKVAVKDTVGLLLSSLIVVGESICDGADIKYSEHMPKFLRELSETLAGIRYDDDDDRRQEDHLSEIFDG
jgi:hypothetical protein